MQCVVRIYGPGSLGGIEKMDFEIAQTNVDFFHLAGL
jgi:hypothetical protein